MVTEVVMEFPTCRGEARYHGQQVIIEMIDGSGPKSFEVGMIMLVNRAIEPKDKGEHRHKSR